jgi:phosphotransferase system enzyme I (PtsI)
MRELEGNTVCHGAGLGTALILEAHKPSMKEPKGDPEQCYARARARAESELRALCHGSREPSRILEAHIAMLLDPEVDSQIKTAMDSCGPKAAVALVYENYERTLASSQNPLTRERSIDVRDVKMRLLRCLDNSADDNAVHAEGPVVLCAYDLLPSQTACLDARLTAAIVTTLGGLTSHCAIIARSLGIPCLAGIDIRQLSKGMRLGVDADKGRLYIDPDEDTCKALLQRRKDLARQALELEMNLDKKAETIDGHSVLIEINLSSADQKANPYCDGVGLLRSEFLFMKSVSIPSAGIQAAAYAKVIGDYAPRPVTVRTIDAGADKKVDCIQMPAEPNPFLGQRAIRLCLARPQIFEPQVEALLLASSSGHLRILLPMIGSLEDFRAAKALIKSVESRLGGSYEYELGVMIEVPSAAIMASELAEEADFASIGTNDLIQYTHAADRQNASVFSYYQSFSPAVFRLISHAASAFKARGKSISVCGEMAGDPDAARILVGLGIDVLSMSESQVAGVKAALRSSSYEELKALGQGVLESGDQASIMRLLEEHPL